jgi:hypothetical protein
MNLLGWLATTLGTAARLRRCESQLAAALDLHQPVGRAWIGMSGTRRATAFRCSTCGGDQWPCATAEALGVKPE